MGQGERRVLRLSDRPIRWIVDDCAKFVQREIRRGSRYDAVIMDPPSYGRGPGGEIWKLEDNVYDLITLTEQVLSDDPLFFAINSYTEGLSPAVMEYIVKTTLCPVKGGHTHCDEIGLPVSATGDHALAGVHMGDGRARGQARQRCTARVAEQVQHADGTASLPYLSWYHAQFTACSGKTPVCLKPVGLTISVKSFQWICHFCGSFLW